MEDAWFWLGEPPAGSLLDLVVPAARGPEVAFAGPAALRVGERVVAVALGRGTAAAGEHAGPVADLDQVPQRLWRHVSGCFPLVGAVAGG